MVKVSLIRVVYSILIFVKCKRSVNMVVQSSDKFVLIRNSAIFVDKTLLLKKICQYDFLLITAPHKFGKTTNLHMIKLFLGNNNPKTKVADVFRNTNIWRDRTFIVKHVCNYPIIYCDMKSKAGVETFEDVEKELKVSVRDAFLEHKYLLYSSKIEEPTKRRYLQYCKLEVEHYEVGLKFLSKVLHMHHGKRVTILIDNFDYLLTYSIFKKELDSTKTAELLFRLLDNSINLNEYVERSVVVGCLPFQLGAQYSGLYLLEHFKFMITKDFTPYFGFTQRETDGLLDKFRLGEYKREVSNWYGGYSYLYSDFQIYNPWSVLMFLKHKKLSIYWVGISSRRMLYNYLEPHYELKEHISNLVKYKNVTIEVVSSFTSYEVDKLKNVQFASYSYAEDYTEDHLFLQLLLESGYLTYAEKYRTVPISTKVKFPNLEIQKVFEQILLRKSKADHATNYKSHKQQTKHEPRRRVSSNQYRRSSGWEGQRIQYVTRRGSNSYRSTSNRDHSRVRPTYSKYTKEVASYHTRDSDSDESQDSDDSYARVEAANSYHYTSRSYAGVPTDPKYTNERESFQRKFTTNKNIDSEEFQDSSSSYTSRNSKTPKRLLQPRYQSNTVPVQKRKQTATIESSEEFEELQSDPFTSNMRTLKYSPKKQHAQQHNFQQKASSSEPLDSESISFFANYRAHLRAGKIKTTPDLIFNPKYKTEKESSLESQPSVSDSFTYNYKTFEEAERLKKMISIKPIQQNKIKNVNHILKSQNSTSHLLTHTYKTSRGTIQINKSLSLPKIQESKESDSKESQSSALSNDFKNDEDDDSLDYSESSSSIQLFTTTQKVSISPDSFISLFAHQQIPVPLMQQSKTDQVTMNLSNHQYPTRSMDSTLSVFRTTKSQISSDLSSNYKTSTIASSLYPKSISVQPTTEYFTTKSYNISFYNNTVKPLLLI